MGVLVNEKVFEKFGKEFMKGDVIFYEGEEGQTMYIIYEGKVKITKRARDVETTLAVLQAGDFFGEMSIIDESPRSATAIVEEDVTKLIVIDQKVFESQIQTNPKIIMQILKKMSARIRDTDKQIENLLLKDITSRIIGTMRMLLDKCEQHDENGYFVFDYEGVQKEIAGRLGLPIAKVIEVLEAVVRGRMAIINGSNYLIRDREELDHYMEYLNLRERYSGV